MNLPEDFNLDLALELANLSNEAYSQHDAHEKGEIWSGPNGYILDTVFEAVYEDKNMPLGFIASKGDDIYISWRGTITPEEWIEDAKCEQVVCSYLPGDTKVELGFHQLYTTGVEGSSPQNTVLNYLKEKQVKGKTYVTGHSLGAALAVLNALDIAKNTHHNHPILYSFAGPRVGSPEYTEIYNKGVSSSWRVVNTNDKVPKLPPEEIDFKHVDNEFDITFGGKWPWDWGDNHFITHYIKQLQKIKQHTTGNC